MGYDNFKCLLDSIRTVWYYKLIPNCLVQTPIALYRHDLHANNTATALLLNPLYSQLTAQLN